MIVNSIGTLLYSFFFGIKVGEDKSGNRFFRHKKNKKKRWVLYNKIVEPTNLEVKWQVWLTDINNHVEPVQIVKEFKWQKKIEANKTGTALSYHPRKNIKNNIIVKKNKNIKATWDPENEK